MVNFNVNLRKNVIFITGIAGFIGSNLAMKLYEMIPGIRIIGIDDLNEYYDVRLKEERLRKLSVYNDFLFIKGSIAECQLLSSIFEEYRPGIVVNLAAQAGVRYSVLNPEAYINSNIIGFFNVLEACRHHTVEHLIYASSSSVYGMNTKIPFAVDDKTDQPASLYAATKKSNEIIAYAYSKLYDIPSTGLRFFTVYGPAGRPDMAYYKFTEKLVKGEKIQIYNCGNCKRDFTYIDDIVTGIVNVMQKAPKADPIGVRHKIYNIGNNKPENLLHFVDILQQELIRANVLKKNFDFRSHMEFVPMQPGDVEVTYADVEELENDFGFRPSVSLRDGLREFACWYAKYHEQKCSISNQ